MGNKIISGGAKPGGGLYDAPLGTPLPTDAQTALPSAFGLISIVSDDGLDEGIDRKSDETRDWNGAVVFVNQTEYTQTWKITLLESSLKTLQSVNGQKNVTEKKVEGGTLTTVEYTEDQLPRRMYAVDIQSGSTILRKVLPEAQITDVGNKKHQKKGPIQYEITITAFKDANGRFGYDYKFEPDTAVTPAV